MIKMIKEFLAYKKSQKIQESPKPFFNLNILNDDGESIEVEMDWNPSFINGLREKGYKGITDEQVIEGYLHVIFEKAYMRNLIKENMSNDSVDD